jgi:hypothetical protein
MRFVAATALLIASCAAVVAQAPEGTPTRIRGTIEKIEGQTLVVKTRAGQDVSITLASNFSVSGVVGRNLADIKAGDYVASTSVRDPDGKLKALEVHYLPQAAAEGQFPYDLAPDSLMTNAVVAGVSVAAQGRVLRVTYKGTEAEITVPPDAPVVAFVPGDLSLVKPGAAVVVNALKQSDGKLTATRATVEKDGVKPPM